MKLENIEKSVIELVTSNMGYEVKGPENYSITLKSSFEDDLGFDSLDSIEFLMAIEERFELDIPDDIAEEFDCIADVVGYVSENH